MSVVRLVACLVVAGVVAVRPICAHAGQSIARGAAAPPLAPGTRYDPAIPTLKQVVGHEAGEAITSPEEIVRYLQALAKAAPDRTLLFEYARSWEGRPLVMLAIGAPGRMSRLDDVKTGLRRTRGSTRPLPGGDRSSRRRAAGRRRADARRARQRDLVGRRRAREAYHLLGGARRRRRRRHPRRGHRAHRSRAEPRRSRALRVPECACAAAAPGRRAARGRARRALARRPRQPLPVRPQSRLVCAVAARNPRARRGAARVDAARRRRPARDGRRLDLLLPAAGATLEPVRDAGRSELVEKFGRANAAALRRARLCLLQPRGLRRVLSRLRRVVADRARRHRDDLRDRRPRAAWPGAAATAPT